MTLFGETPPKEKKVRAKKPAAPESEALLRVEAAFLAAFERAWGFPTKREGIGFERKLLKALIESWGEDDVLRLVEVFFSTTKRRGDYSVRDFCRSAQTLRLEQRRGPGSQDVRTAGNLDAAARATGRQK